LAVLVPGAGLGRLAFEIAKSGFSCQGNEFSFYMLIASNFALNKLKKANDFEIYPWIHTFSNIPQPIHQLASVQIPDVAPGGIPKTADFSMVAGDFLEIYSDKSQLGMWDCVVTCYFIDTAKNIIEYLEVIAGALKVGGVWINNGPLLYHFEGMRTEISIDLNLEEVKSVARKMGFVFEVSEHTPTFLMDFKTDINLYHAWIAGGANDTLDLYI
jgi:carnosine N-methyltransferase